VVGSTGFLRLYLMAFFRLYPLGSGLFLGILNKGGIHKSLGGGCNHARRANLH